MPWNTSGTFAVRFSVDTLTANREFLFPNVGGVAVVVQNADPAVVLSHQGATANFGVELAANRAIPGNTQIDFHATTAGTAQSDYDFRIIRMTGASGEAEIINVGGGPLRLSASLVAVNGPMNVSAAFSVRGFAGLSAAAANTPYLTGGWTSPVAMRIIFGDKSGWHLRFSNLSANVLTDVFSFNEGTGEFAAVGKVSCSHVVSLNTPKAWATFAGTAGGVIIYSSYNISSVTRASSGVYSLQFQTFLTGNANWFSGNHAPGGVVATGYTSSLNSASFNHIVVALTTLAPTDAIFATCGVLGV